MSRIKDLLGIAELVDEKTKTMKDDLYKSIKEVSELKYRVLEAETKLANLEGAVKIFTGGG